MKTITEFPGFLLTNALKAKLELISSGKTDEEAGASLGETYKYEGDKLKFFLNSITVISEKTEKLRRVIVVQLAENENGPAGGKKIDEQMYLAEYYQAITKSTEEPEKNSSKRNRNNKKKDDNRRGGRDGRDAKNAKGGQPVTADAAPKGDKEKSAKH